MKKKYTIKVLLGLALAGFPVMANAAPLTFVKDGKPNAAIVLQDKAPAPMQSAAKDLQTYIKKMTGVELPLKTDGKDVAGITLNVGKTATAQDSDFPDKELNPETYAIKQRGDDVYFTGNYPSPTAFAVYSFLQDQLGVRWFAPGEDWEYVPQLSSSEKSTFTVDVKDVVSVPGTSPRVWSGHQWTQDWTDWNLRNKAVQSEKVFRRNFQNNIYRVFPPSKYAKTHPEYYPLVNGKRWIPPNDDYRYWWPPMGNPDVQRITAEYIHQWFKDHPDQDSFSLGMDDIAYMSNDPQSNAMDSSPDDYKNRNFSSRFYKFINIVAKQVKKTDPDKYIGVLIYQIAKQLPPDVPELEDNVFGFIADGSVAQWYQTGNKADWMHRTMEWRQRVNILSRYEYYGLGTFVPRVFPHAMAENIQLDKALGFEGMYTEVYTFLPHTAPMMWAFAQMQWNPEKNVDLLLNEFYNKMYPSTAVEMQKYFDLLEYSWNTERPGHVGWVHRNIIHQAASISPEAVHEGMKMLDDAYEKAKTPVEKRRIDIVRGGLKFASYAVLEYDLAQRISAASVTNENQANTMLKNVQQFAELISSRQKYWAEAEKRQDILGANIRAFQKPLYGTSPPYLQSDFGPIESPSVAGILRLADWYQENQPTKSKQIIDDLLKKLPEGFAKDALGASQWLADPANKNAKSVLNNGDFSDKSANTDKAENDWDTEGAPKGWSTWSRNGSGTFVRVAGHEKNAGIRISAVNNGETADLLQSVPAKPDERYIVVAWVKLDDVDHSNDVSAVVRFRSKSGWNDKYGRPRILATKEDGWQRLLLSFAVPEESTAATLMLEANGTSATFSDVRLYKVTP